MDLPSAALSHLSAAPGTMLPLSSWRVSPSYANCKTLISPAYEDFCGSITSGYVPLPMRRTLGPLATGTAVGAAVGGTAVGCAGAAVGCAGTAVGCAGAVVGCAGT